MSGAEDDPFAVLMIAGSVVVVAVLVALAPFVAIANVLGTCTGYLTAGVEGLYITGELGGWVLLLVGLGGALLARRMPYLWRSLGRGRNRLYVVFGVLVIVYVVAFVALSKGSPPTCATLPSERLWTWLGGIIP